MSTVYILIPLLPLLASIVIVLAGRRLGEASAKIGVLAIGISFGLSVVAFLQILRGDPIIIPLYEFLRSGQFVVELGLYIDQLAVLLLLLVTGVGLVVHVYSSRYMTGDERYSRFFAVMALFSFGMITLVMSSNLLMMFMCWEVMGICSYLLISHQSDRKAACHAATKAFLVNAIADVGLLFGIVLTYATFQTLDIRQILDASDGVSGQTINLLSWMGLEWPVRTVTLITLFLFMGCLGKSAQVPFHVWLPNAMEAPTPVSALIHAATMVNAGPYLLVRFSELVVLSPAAMTVIAVVGAITALFAAVVSLTQSDIKKILAYSTISQIGFMIMTCGLGAFVVAIFHMLAHGCLKGFLFLSTGNQLAAAGAHVNHGSSADHGRPPALLYLGALILACAPPLLIFSGPYESLWTVHNFMAARIAFWVMGLLTVFFTSMYLFRGIASLFRAIPSTVVQPRLSSPLHFAAVAGGAVGLGGILLGLWVGFVPFLAPAVGTQNLLTESVMPTRHFVLIVLPFVAALAGWGLACALYLRPLAFFAPRSPFGQTMYLLFLNKFYFDEIYTVFIIQPAVRFVRWLWRVVDVGGINNLVQWIATTSVEFARWMWRMVDQGIDRWIHGIATSGISFSGWMWRVVDVRGIDRAVNETGDRSVGLARWLWEAVDVRRIERSADQIGETVDVSGRKLRDVEPRTLQHHLVVLIAWLIVAIVFFYGFVL